MAASHRIGYHKEGSSMPYYVCYTGRNYTSKHLRKRWLYLNLYRLALGDLVQRRKRIDEAVYDMVHQGILDLNLQKV